jgi:serine/threonine protein kinase
LAAAHRKGIVHRDVRPANVIIEEETDRVVLMDFGIAALLENAAEQMPRLTAAGQRVGDPTHMSPEQLKGDPVTGQFDLFGLGVMAYELLTGRGPFGAIAGPAAARMIQGSEPPALEDLLPESTPSSGPSSATASRYGRTTARARRSWPASW